MSEGQSADAHINVFMKKELIHIKTFNENTTHLPKTCQICRPKRRGVLRPTYLTNYRKSTFTMLIWAQVLTESKKWIPVN